MFAFPESAARAFGRAARLGSWRARPTGEIPALDDVDRAAARRVVDARLTGSTAEGAWLDGTAAATVLDAYGIPNAPVRYASSAEAARAAAEALGFPIALKVGNPNVVHKTNVGGVALALSDGDAVERAFRLMHDRLGTEMGGAVVQRMVPEGLEVIVGITQDPLFGPLLLFGAGGVTAELLADRTLRVLPLSTQDARETVRSLRTSPLFFGYRGAPPVDVDALERLLVRVAQLADNVPEITEMDLNPVIVSEHGVVAVDAKIRCAPAPYQVPPDLRRMRD
jgi:acyl-CoA synthetase (NDP forming)